jgi:hypothetical protein
VATWPTPIKTPDLKAPPVVITPDALSLAERIRHCLYNSTRTGHLEACYWFLLDSILYAFLPLLTLKNYSMMLVAHVSNPSYLGGWDQDCESRPAQANSSGDPHLQNNQSKMDERCGSSSRAPAVQVWSPQFKSQSYQKIKIKINCSYNSFSTFYESQWIIEPDGSLWRPDISEILN